MNKTVKALIDHYNLIPLDVEKTLFHSNYRSADEFENGKPKGTAIIGMYCQEPYSVSLFHKLTADEIWHFYGGDPLRLILLYPDGRSREVVMGSDPLKGELVQFVVPAGVWQAGELIEGGLYSLYGCTMAPGFTDDMFEGGVKEELITQYPDRIDDIRRLGCNPDQVKMAEGSAR